MSNCKVGSLMATKLNQKKCLTKQIGAEATRGCTSYDFQSETF